MHFEQAFDYSHLMKIGEEGIKKAGETERKKAKIHQAVAFNQCTTG